MRLSFTRRSLSGSVFLLLFFVLHPGISRSSECVRLENDYLTTEIDPAKGARGMRLSVQGGENIAHPVYGLFSDHPSVENWEAFRYHPYSVAEVVSPRQATFIGLKDGIELEKTIELSANSPSLSVRYRIRNRSEAPVFLNSAIVDFFQVPKEEDTFVIAYLTSQDGAILGKANSAASSYDNYYSADARDGSLHTYFPEQAIEVSISLFSAHLDHLCLSSSSRQYIALESFLTFEEIATGECVEFVRKYSFGLKPELSADAKEYMTACSKELEKRKETLTMPVTPPYPGRKLGISGAFYSFWGVGPFINADKQLAQREMQAMKEAGLDTVILETGFSQGVIYRSQHYHSLEGCENVLDYLVEAADRVGLKIILSIPFVNLNPFLLNDDQLAEVKNRSLLFLEELHGKFGQVSGLSGWYTGFEISDMMIADASERQRIAGFYRGIADACHRITPDLPVSIAPYFMAGMLPDEFEEVWRDFLELSNLDIFMIQDGVGCIYISNGVEGRLAILPAYYQALQKACSKAGVRFWSDLEIFEQIHGAGIDDRELVLIPAEFSRVKRQLEIEQEYVEKIVVYEFANYLSPNGIVKGSATRAKGLYKDYQSYRLKPISGTFYQPSKGCPLGTDREKWNAMFSEMKSLGMDTFIVQWAVANGIAYYPSELEWISEKGPDFLTLCFEMAEKWDFDIIVGLDFGDEWWNHESGDLLKTATHNEAIAGEIAAKYLPSERFSGWYVPQEISNYTSTVPGMENEIREFLTQTALVCDRITPGKTLSIAPFFNGQSKGFSKPEEYAEWMRRTTENTGIDIIMLQDGIGAHPIPYAEMIEYFQALRHSLAGTEIELWSDLEIFDFKTEGGRRQIETASFDRVKAQIMAEGLWVDKIVCFAYPNYGFSLMGERQKKFHQEYLDYYQSILSAAK